MTLDAVVSGYVKGMTDAAVATQKLDTAAGKLAAQQQAFDGIGKGALAVGAFAAAGVGLAVAKFADFDKAMSNVQAATHESASNMDLLRDAALEAGRTTVFSATESSAAIEELSKAGLSTAEILDGALSGALDLAAAGGLEVAQAAEIAATTLAQFNLEGSETEHIADLLAAGAGKASGEVSDLSAALAQSGQVASATGLTVEETTGALAAFAQAGLKGSDAGTSLKTALSSLNPRSAEAEKLMADLGISAYDAQGNFIGLAEFAGRLQDGLSGLSTQQRQAALSTIFGADAIRAATVLYDEGAEGIQDWITAVDDQGYAAETAALRLDNLAGDVEAFGGAMETALIGVGEGADGPLRGLVQGATDVVAAFADAPEPVQNTALAIGGVTAAVGLMGGAALLAVPKAAAYKASLESLNISGGKVAKGVAGAAIAITGMALVVSQLASQQAEARASAEAYADTLEEGSQRTTAATRDMVVANLQAKQSLNLLGLEIDAVQFDSAADAAEKLGLSVSTVADATMGSVEALEQVAAVTKLRNRTDEDAVAVREKLGLKEGEWADAIDSVVNGVKGESASLEEAIRLARQHESAVDDGTAATEGQTSALEEFTSVTATAQQSVDDFITALQGLGDTQLSLNDANRQVEASLDDATEVLDKFKQSVYDTAIANGASEEAAHAAADAAVAQGQALDITTEAGRENQAALDAIAESYKKAAAATVEQTGVQSDAIPVIQAGRDAIVAAGEAAGMSKEQAGAYADQLGLIPGDVSTQVNLHAQAAMDAATAFARKLAEIPNSKEVYLYVQEQRIASGAPAGQVGAAYANADGGMYSYSSGGFGEGFYSGRQGALYKFAEPEVGWEAFISGRPGKEAENRGYALEAYGRLGGQMPAGDTIQHFSYNASPIREMDPRAVNTIMMREFARKIGG
ncbi:hypothetical protein ATC03_07920 [Agromyces aureus]|uniref:Phage tail tape measure protein domain-containing protein n=1 Tax=Agromyces aureus TaxID=453304 RepID=A0A191WEM8_9MICO|nr:hypothetical protein ATC03_07920 [Agromyces aureus]